MDPQLKYLMVTLGTMNEPGRIDNAYFSLDALLGDVVRAIKKGKSFEVYELPDECYSYSNDEQ